MCLSMLPAVVAAEEDIQGDVNGDGTVNGADLVRLQEYLSGESVEINTALADMDGSGTITESDLQLLKNLIAGVTGITLSSDETETMTGSWNADYLSGICYVGDFDYYVCFYVEVPYMLQDQEREVGLYSKDWQFVCSMYDDGNYSQFFDGKETHPGDGDELPGDNVYSCRIGFDTDNAKDYTFYAVCGEMVSNEVTFSVIAGFTPEELDSMDDVNTAIVTLKESFDEMTVEQRTEAAFDMLAEYTDDIKEGSVEYDEGTGTIMFEFTSGVICGLSVGDDDEGMNSFSSDSDTELQTEPEDTSDTGESTDVPEGVTGETPEETELQEPEAQLGEETEKYPWDKLNDEEFAAWVTDGENDDFIKEILADSTSERYAAFSARIEAIAEETLRLEVEGYCSALKPEEQEENTVSEEDELLAARAEAAASYVYAPNPDANYGDAKPSYGKAIILYGFKGDRSIESYKLMKSKWEEQGLSTVLVQDATLSDFKKLKDYDLVYIAMHGGAITNSKIPAFGYLDVVTREKNEQYSLELHSGQVFQFNGYYAILPFFFRDSVTLKKGAIVFSETCSAMGDNESIVPIMSNYIISAGADIFIGSHHSVDSLYAFNLGLNFVNRLLGEDTVKDAFDASLAYTEEHFHRSSKDIFVYYLNGSDEAKQKTLINKSLNNGSFEQSSKSPKSWSTEGDVRILTKLGTLKPQNGTYMAIITSGIGSKKQMQLNKNATEGSVLSQRFMVPPNATKITFNYDVVSEEPLEWVGSPFDDKFGAIVSDNNGNVFFSKTIESVNASTWYKIDNINFDGGDNTTYHTKWKTYTIDVSKYRGQYINLVFMVFDVQDNIYDTAVLIDNVKVS